jgi:hypothetical protein
MHQNGIPRVCFYFCSKKRNSKLFSLPHFRTEFREFAFIFVPQYTIPSIFLLCGMVRNGSEGFLFRGTAGIPPEQTNCSIYSVYRGKFFCRKLPTLLIMEKRWVDYLTRMRLGGRLGREPVLHAVKPGWDLWQKAFKTIFCILMFLWCCHIVLSFLFFSKFSPLYASVVTVTYKKKKRQVFLSSLTV